MRILVLGAGGVGGYFGGRLVEAGADVTFFVRPARARVLDEKGLRIESRLGNLTTTVKTLSDPHASMPFDLVMIACKAYDLDSSLAAIVGAVGEKTAVLPLLNGVAHIDKIGVRFPHARLWGGVAQISATLTEDGVIQHFDDVNSITFGTLAGAVDERAEALLTLFRKTPANAYHSARIMQELWDKFVFLTTLAGITSLMRASIDEILATPSGGRLIAQLIDECAAVAGAVGFRLDADKFSQYRTRLTRRGFGLKASMLRDIERGSRTEGEHILGDMFARAQRFQVSAPLLEIALTHVRTYEIQRVVNSAEFGERPGRAPESAEIAPQN